MTYPYLYNLRVVLAVGLVSWGIMWSSPLPAGDSLSVRINHWVDSLVLDPPLEELSTQDWKPLATAPTKMSSSYSYYLRLEGYHAKDTPLTQWLAVGVFDSLSLYYQDSMSQWHRQERGLLVDYATQMKQAFRQFKANKYGFLLTWPVNEKRTYYLRIHNTVRFEGNLAHIQLLPTGQTPRPGPEQALGFLAFHAVFFGIFLFFIAFSLIQYTQQGDWAYLFYASYLGTAVLYFWWKFEKANSFLNFLFTEWQEAYYYWEVPLGILIYLSYFYFVVHFLNARKELPRLYRIIRLSTPLLLIFLGLHLFVVLIWGLSVGWELFYWLRFILFPLGFMAIYQVFSTRHQLAFYIMSGTTAMLVGGLITSIMSKSSSQHYAGYWDLPLLPIQVGMLLELFFFSAGLAYKGRLMVEEKLALQLNLRQQAAEVERVRTRKAALTDLYARLSHEFRTPLTIIRTALSRIQGHRREREMIGRYSKQVLKSINQVMDLHKLEAQRMEVDWVRGDVYRFIRYRVCPFALLAQDKAQQFSLHTEGERLLMDFDEDKLGCILENLLSNAIKYNTAGGTISVIAKQLADATDNHLSIVVRDEGTGLTAAEQAHIFEAYRQGDASRGGTGIGLTLVREYTHLLGGQITVESVAGQGSTFTLRLPVQQSATVAAKWLPEAPDPVAQNRRLAYQAPQEVDTQRPTLLVVEDNEDVAWLLRALLQDHYNILTAADGEMGWAAVQKTRPDLMLSDVMMPKLDGLALCHRLRAHQLTQHIPVILLSAKASEVDRLAGLEVGADAYLTKPFSEAELLIRIRQLLQNRRKPVPDAQILAVPTEGVLATSVQSVAFLEQFHDVLLRHLSDPSFKVKDLCRELAINHVSLNKKIRTYTEQSTAQYVRNFRMHQARQLLENTDLGVAQVGYQVGITEASNFGNLFRKTFGVSPGEWKRRVLAGEG